MIKPIVKMSVSEQVYLQMKQMIIDNEWTPGTKLPSEGELRILFNVSRVTVRNALHKLSALGLIDTKIGDGSYVASLSKAGACINNLIPVAYLEEDVMTVLEFRREVESATCALAAQKATPKDVKELRKMLLKMDLLQGNLESLPIADLEFHYLIAKISSNSLIIRTYEIVSDIYTSHMKRTVKSMGGEIGVYWHKKIVDAIEQHDVEKARLHMFKHITKNIDFYQTGKATIDD